MGIDHNSDEHTALHCTKGRFGYHGDHRRKGLGYPVTRAQRGEGNGGNIHRGDEAVLMDRLEVRRCQLRTQMKKGEDIKNVKDSGIASFPQEMLRTSR